MIALTNHRGEYMYQKIIFFGTIVFFGFAMMVSFQNCTTVGDKSAVGVNNQVSDSRIQIYNETGKLDRSFKTGEKANFVFQNVVAVCVSEPGAENHCVDEKGFPKSASFSELADGIAPAKLERQIELLYPGKIMIYGFTNDPVYPVISSSLIVHEGPKPANSEQ